MESLSEESLSEASPFAAPPFVPDLDIVLEEEKPEDIYEKDWVRLNVKACGMIRSCLCREQKYPFMKEMSTNKLWKALENKYMKRSTNINSHIDTFNKLIADFLNLDQTFKDEHKAMLLIGSLPDELDHLSITLLHGKEKLSFKEVCSALSNHEIRKKDQKENRDE
ncbi:uncharacterized protein LOC116120703 [Pistacia vera]|uniref:uncharacterized protein LOC116120703 n=1 Tax=Pistacia vera TaxID=55513 RepID=UPI001263B393|nr:uncharacterized protein LOC116120703 [Pistacia vera]